MIIIDILQSFLRGNFKNHSCELMRALYYVKENPGFIKMNNFFYSFPPFYLSHINISPISTALPQIWWNLKCFAQYLNQKNSIHPARTFLMKWATLLYRFQILRIT